MYTILYLKTYCQNYNLQRSVKRLIRSVKGNYIQVMHWVTGTLTCSPLSRATVLQLVWLIVRRLPNPRAASNTNPSVPKIRLPHRHSRWKDTGDLLTHISNKRVTVQHNCTFPRGSQTHCAIKWWWLHRYSASDIARNTFNCWYPREGTSKQHETSHYWNTDGIFNRQYHKANAKNNEQAIHLHTSSWSMSNKLIQEVNGFVNMNRLIFKIMSQQLVTWNSKIGQTLSFHYSSNHFQTNSIDTMKFKLCMQSATRNCLPE